MPDPSIFTSVINNYLPEPQSSLLNGILFGINIKSTPIFYDSLKRVGLLHIVVLSGINISILATTTAIFFRRLGQKISAFIAVFIIIGFIMFVGPKPPIVRAAITGSLSLIAVCFGRRSITLYSLLISLLFIVIFIPQWITTVSLQLSYAATLGIVLFDYSYNKNDHWLKQKLYRYSKPTLAAYLFTTPIIFLYFRQLSLIAPLSNMLIGFIIAPLMAFGFLTAFLGKVHFVFGLIPALVSYGILSYLVFIIDLLVKIPYSFIQF